MKTPLIALLLLGPILCGCVGTLSAPATRDAQSRADAAFAACDAQLRDGILKSHGQVVDCARPKVLAAYQENGYPNMDLVELDLGVRFTALIDLDDSHRLHLTPLVSASGGRGRGVRPQSQPSDRG